MKLIDILNLIAKGELEEGTKIKWRRDVYTYNGDDEFVDEENYSDLWEDMYLGSLNEEIEIIAKDTNVATKIEELDVSCTTWNDLYIEQKANVLFNKLNEVIRVLNRRSE